MTCKPSYESLKKRVDELEEGYWELLNAKGGDTESGKEFRSVLDEIEDAYIGQDPTDIELIIQRMTRDVYSEGGQIHGPAVAAIEVACWDILGKSVGQPVHRLMGGRMRSRTRTAAPSSNSTTPPTTSRCSPQRCAPVRSTSSPRPVRP